MKIGIIGYGFVGKALEAGFTDAVKILKIDPKLNSKIDDLVDFDPDAIFICVPTPMNDDGTQMISILQDVISKILKLTVSPLVVIKSTVLPIHLSNIEKLGLKYIYNPEFLREKYANEDFINSELILFGGQKNYTNRLAEFYKNHTNCVTKQYQQTDLISASLIKYRNVLRKIFIHRCWDANENCVRFKID